MRLRHLTPEDAREIFLLRSDDRVNKFIDRPKAISLEDAKAFITKIIDGIAEGKSFYWGIALKDQQELIGTICIWNFSEDRTVAEVGYELRPEFQKRGLMDEALKAVINYAKDELHVKSLEAFSHRDNQGSQNLLQKNNFRLTDRIDQDNSYNVIYTLHLSPAGGG